jgi:hypothetical protein
MSKLKRSPRIYLFTALVFAIVLGIFGTRMLLIAKTTSPISPGVALAQQMSGQCKNENVKARQICLEKLMIQKTTADPDSASGMLMGFSKLLQSGAIKDDPRLFSPIVHEIGMTLADNVPDLKKPMSLCNFDFRGACVHGVVMEYIDDRYAGANPATFFGLCNNAVDDKGSPDGYLEYMNCIHGLGHEFAAKINGSLSDMLAPCETLAVQYQDECTSGVFMEYSKGAAGEGRHSDAPVGTKELPCADVQPNFQSSCYTSAGFYRQYEVTSESWTASYTFCSTMPAAHQNDCFGGVLSALLFSNGGDQQKSLAVCNSLSPLIKEIAFIRLALSESIRPFAGSNLAKH